MTRIRHAAVPAVYVVLKKGDELLLMRRFNTGYQDGLYSLCSGHVEAGEFPVAGLVREIKEEIGVEVKLEDLQLVHTMYRAKRDETGERVDLFFTCSKWSGEITNVEPQKCDDIQWFPMKKLPSNIIPFVKSALESIEQNTLYSEIN